MPKSHRSAPPVPPAAPLQPRTPFSQDHPARDLPIGRAALAHPALVEIIDGRIEERVTALETIASAQRAAAGIAAKLHAIDSELRQLYNSIPEDPLDQGREEGQHPPTVAFEIRMALMLAYGGDSGAGIEEVIGHVLRAASVTVEDCDAEFKRQEPAEEPRVA